MIQLKISPDVLRAAALFVSKRSGHGNPNAGIHLRYRDEYSIRLAATDGTAIMYARLQVDTERLEEMYWSEDEREPGVLSILVTPQLLAVLPRMDESIVIDAGVATVRLLNTGEIGETTLTVPRLPDRQMALFDDLDNLPAFSLDDLAPRGQVAVNVGLLDRIVKAAKLLGIEARSEVDIAILEEGRVHGHTLGAEPNLWWFARPLTVTAAATAGLPPEWVNGEGDGSIGAVLDAVGHIEDIAEVEQPALDLDGGEEERAEEFTAQAESPLEWVTEYDDADNEIHIASSCQHTDGIPFCYRIKAGREGICLTSDPELMSDGDDTLPFGDVETAKLFCEGREQEVILSITRVSHTCAECSFYIEGGGVCVVDAGEDDDGIEVESNEPACTAFKLCDSLTSDPDSEIPGTAETMDGEPGEGVQEGTFADVADKLTSELDSIGHDARAHAHEDAHEMGQNETALDSIDPADEGYADVPHAPYKDSLVTVRPDNAEPFTISIHQLAALPTLPALLPALPPGNLFAIREEAEECGEQALVDAITAELESRRTEAKEEVA